MEREETQWKDPRDEGSFGMMKMSSDSTALVVAESLLMMEMVETLQMDNTRRGVEVRTGGKRVSDGSSMYDHGHAGDERKVEGGYLWEILRP